MKRIVPFFLCLGMFAQDPAPAPQVTIVPAVPSDPREEALSKLLQNKRTSMSAVKAVVLRYKDKDVSLDGMPGGHGHTMAFFTAIIWSNFPELTAPVHITDHLPSVFTAFEGGSPRGKLFLVKVEPDKGKSCRSLKMGNSGFGSVSNVGSPDQDWVIPTTSKEVKPGIWEFTPGAPLKKGEYGLFATMAAGFSGGTSGEIFDFAID
jgi:hypothetical protein